MQLPLCSDPARQMQSQSFASLSFSCHLNDKSQFVSIYISVFSCHADILRISIITRIRRITDPDAYSTQIHNAVSFDVAGFKAASYNSGVMTILSSTIRPWMPIFSSRI